MAIPKSFISQLLLHCEIEDVVSSYVTLKNEGRHRKGLCPFHSEKTPSMVVYNDTQSFYCFGCGAGGDAISFMMRIENLDYVEAVKLLAQRAGLQIPDDAQDDRTGKLKARILEINRVTARFFHESLKKPEGQAGLKYFKERQLSDKMITKYGLGYAPLGWDNLLKHLRAKGFSLEEMDAAKVITKGKNGSYYDFFRNRAMFPVIDLRGNVIAFGGRVLDDSKPKYLNTSDTPVFKKSRNLFSMNYAKNAGSRRLILAEGYMDVIAIHAAGFENVVATLGTALTAEQARLISKYADEVIIAYDSDGAGQAATHRAINLLSEVSVTTKTIAMEGAKDPDEFIKKFGVKRFELLLDHSGNVIEFELRKLREAYDLEEIDGKIEYSKRAVSVLSNIRNPLEREVYAGIVARETGLSVDRILSQVKSANQRKRQAQEKREWADIQSNKKESGNRINPERITVQKEARAEDGVIAFLFRNPDYGDYIFSKLSPDDFVTTFNRRVFSVLADRIKADDEILFAMFSEAFTIEEQGEISRILAINSKEKQTNKLIDDYIDVLLTHKDSLKSKDIGLMNVEQLEEFRKKKAQQKKK